MFTGRISELGTIDGADGDTVVVHAPKSAARLQVGGSVTVNGVRLTLCAITDSGFAANLSAETRRRSTFDDAAVSAAVNVECALALGDPLDGHLVQGHVDAVGRSSAWTTRERAGGSGSGRRSGCSSSSSAKLRSRWTE